MSEDHDPMHRVANIILGISVVVILLLIIWAWEASQ